MQFNIALFRHISNAFFKNLQIFFFENLWEKHPLRFASLNPSRFHQQPASFKDHQQSLAESPTSFNLHPISNFFKQTSELFSDFFVHPAQFRCFSVRFKDHRGHFEPSTKFNIHLLRVFSSKSLAFFRKKFRIPHFPPHPSHSSASHHPLIQTSNSPQFHLTSPLPRPHG